MNGQHGQRMTSTLTLHAAPGAGFDQPFEMLAACHERVERLLQLLERLAAHLQASGNDAQARSAAQDVMRYFDIAGPAHHEDEERHVFPALAAGPDRALRALVQRLREEHVAMVSGWAAVRADLAALLEQPAALLAVDAPNRWAAFAALYRQHIVAEEAEVYPAGQALLSPAGQAAMGQEMAQRRGAWPAPPPAAA
jgi:hemerythrin-like domain-containing protein